MTGDKVPISFVLTSLPCCLLNSHLELHVSSAILSAWPQVCFLAWSLRSEILDTSKRRDGPWSPYPESDQSHLWNSLNLFLGEKGHGMVSNHIRNGLKDKWRQGRKGPWDLRKGHKEPSPPGRASSEEPTVVRGRGQSCQRAGPPRVVSRTQTGGIVGVTSRGQWISFW